MEAGLAAGCPGCSKALLGCGSAAGARLAPGRCPQCEIKMAERLGGAQGLEHQ